jgi:hypothetical protein
MKVEVDGFVDAGRNGGLGNDIRRDEEEEEEEED